MPAGLGRAEAASIDDVRAAYRDLATRHVSGKRVLAVRPFTEGNPR
jgi:hypothetical protein